MGRVRLDDRDLLNFVRKWNVKYPIDSWWRRKYNVAFGSQAHKEVSVLHMRLEYLEDVERNRVLSVEDKKGEYIPNRGKWIDTSSAQTLTRDETDDLFDKIDLDNLTVQEDGSIIL